MTSGDEGEGAAPTGTVFSIERYAVHDGGGIRTMVYLKGCPLKCLWCANPEGQARDPELFRFPERCIGCGRCDAACPTKAARSEGGASTSCTVCGRCVEACPAEARKRFGRSMTVEQVVREILKDRAFYRRSGGGVTLSGGEPATQAEFGRAVLAACQAHGLDTAVETCGFAPFAALAGLAAHCDLFLYDLKHMDPDAHRRLTGVPNEIILANLQRLAGLRTILVRVPIIPGSNDGADNLAALARFVSGLSPVPEIELLPYHNYGSAKYARAGRSYALCDVALPTTDYMQSLAAQIRAAGVPCHVG
jgi:pyruvate formate lyase activating enzyme